MFLEVYVPFCENLVMYQGGGARCTGYTSHTMCIAAPAQGVKLRGGKVLKKHENFQVLTFKGAKLGKIT